MSMKKPCAADLTEAAEMLRDKRHLRLGSCGGAAARVALCGPQDTPLGTS